MAYILSEELQRKKYLSQSYFLWSMNPFGSVDDQMKDVYIPHTTAEWDVSLQEMVSALYETEECLPSLDVNSCRNEHTGDSIQQQSFQYTGGTMPSMYDSAVYGESVLGDAAMTASDSDPRFRKYLKMVDDEKERISKMFKSPPLPDNSALLQTHAIGSPAFLSESSRDDLNEDRKSSLFDSASLREDINLLFNYMAENLKRDEAHLSSSQHFIPSSGKSTPRNPPLAHSTPHNYRSTETPPESFNNSEWTAILYNEFRNRIFLVSAQEIGKSEIESSRIDNDLLDFVRKIFDLSSEPNISSRNKAKERNARNISCVLNEMRVVGLDIKRHLPIWDNAWKTRATTIKIFTDSLSELPHTEVRNRLLKVSFNFNECHRVLLNCVLMLYNWQSSLPSSISGQDVNLKDVLQKKGEKDFARFKSGKSLSQTMECDSDASESNYSFSDRMNMSNLVSNDQGKSTSEKLSKDTFFDEFEWQAILFEELKTRILNELSYLVGDVKSLYEEEDGLRVMNAPGFDDVLAEVFPETELNIKSLTAFSKIFSGLSRFTYFNFSRHLLQWHSVYKSQPKALKRYGKESVSYTWLIGELNFLNYLENHPLRIMIDCLLMLAIDKADVAVATSNL